MGWLDGLSKQALEPRFFLTELNDDSTDEPNFTLPNRGTNEVRPSYCTSPVEMLSIFA